MADDAARFVGVDGLERDIGNAVNWAEDAVRGARELIEEKSRWVGDEDWANALASVVRRGRQHVLFLLHERSYAWFQVEPSLRARVDQAQAGLVEMATVARDHGCLLLGHESLPGDTPPSIT